MSKLKLKLITPVRVVLETEAEEAVLETKDGQITILPHHAPLVSVLKPGALIARADGKELPIATAGGVVEMRNNVLTVLADTAEHASEIDSERAEKRARELAETLASETKLDINTYNNLAYILERDRARIEVSKRWRK